MSDFIISMVDGDGNVLDAMEIIRCCDCRFFEPYPPFDACVRNGKLVPGKFPTTGSDFCSRGSRKWSTS